MRVAICLVLAACTGTIDPTPPDPVPDPYGAVADPAGPPRYTSRVHGCAKMRYRTLGNLLVSRGVDVTATDPVSAGGLYGSGAAALGAPDYAQRVRENVDVGLATMSKMFDIYLQAAPEIIANMASRPECGGAQLFDAQNHCLPRGITCLIGVPATQQHVDVCNQTVASAADVDSGKRLAVAVLASAAHTCE